MTDTIQYQQAGHVGRLLLNVPQRHNALGGAELHAIRDILSQIQGDSTVRVLVITGAGEKTFCAGASLVELNSGKISGELFQETTDQLAALPIPTIAAINGNVFGGGVELALSCDFRFGVEGSRLRVPAAAIGLCYPVGGIKRFVERLGVAAAKRLLLAADQLDSRAMLEMGFLDYLVARESLADEVGAFAEKLAQLAPLAVKSMKEVITAVASGSLESARADALVALCRDSADLQEGFAAQKEKRQPCFVGR
ncbi:enoyl-CoA hydratase/isomerase family protein [Parahaliea aestuarii]|uniref:Enoyl-CoA hydratase/isomerase family protein n=2 Tax=Parahaliea aestuarii TaxID=1852021 RepID=A0A5C8ZPJ3_9GAMM|nr:enoyl-CoA hydratase/isomerase family protein [Parahaliea aestuarii]